MHSVSCWAPSLSHSPSNTHLNARRRTCVSTRVFLDWWLANTKNPPRPLFLSLPSNPSLPLSLPFLCVLHSLHRPFRISFLSLFLHHTFDPFLSCKPPSPMTSNQPPPFTAQIHMCLPPCFLPPPLPFQVSLGGVVVLRTGSCIEMCQGCKKTRKVRFLASFSVHTLRIIFEASAFWY